MYHDYRSSGSCINIYIYYYYYYHYHYDIELACNVMKMISVHFVEIDDHFFVCFNFDYWFE